MIKLPTTIVIYPQRQSAPDYLLCWIPASEYGRMIKKRSKKSFLKKLYPQGIEIELSDEGLQEYGIDLGAGPEQLRQAYLGLNAAGVLPESGMVELDTLQGILAEEPDGPQLELAAAEAGAVDYVESLDRRGLLGKLRAGPPMTAGQEPTDVYRRLDATQQDKGGE